MITIPKRTIRLNNIAFYKISIVEYTTNLLFYRSNNQFEMESFCNRAQKHAIRGDFILYALWHRVWLIKWDVNPLALVVIKSYSISKLAQIPYSLYDFNHVMVRIGLSLQLTSESDI